MPRISLHAHIVLTDPVNPEPFATKDVMDLFYDPELQMFRWVNRQGAIEMVPRERMYLIVLEGVEG